MTIDQVIKYVLYTPHNTNKVILKQMLKQLIVAYGGNPDGPVGPDVPAESVIYDGGVEV